MASLPRILFVRHGETDWNAEGRLQGQKDTPLNALGRVQAKEAGRRLGTLASNIDALPWIVSPLSRTRETAEIARKALNLDPTAFELEERAKELTFGRWEGYTWKELRKQDANVEKRRAADKWAFVPPEGESYAMLAKRLKPWIETITVESVIVSHGGVARALMAMIGGMTTDTAPQQDVWQGRVLVVEAGGCRWV